MDRGRRIRSVVLAGVAGLGLAAALPGTAWAAGTAPRPVPTYRAADGAKRVEGRPSTADTAPLEIGTVHEDTIGPEERFYQLRLDATSDVYVSAVVRPPAAAKVGYGDGIEVEIISGAGTRCSGSARAGFGYDPVPVSAAAVRRVKEDGECQAAATYYAKVTRTAAKDSDRGRWPVELLVLREPALGGGSPTVAPSVWPSASPTLPGGASLARTGGTGFNDARALGAGVWRDDLRPGQTRYYRVPLDWGQQLGIGAEIAAARMTKEYGSASNGLTVSVYSPYRALVDSKATSYDGKQAGVTLPKMAPVAYENRFSDDAEMRGTRVAGWYYVAVTLGGKVGEFTEDAVPVPLTLRMDVLGTPGKAPAYRESLSAAGFGVDAADRTAAKEGLTGPEAAAAEENRSVMRVVATGGFGAGTVLLLVLGGWILLSRRGDGAGRR
ncbi:hypothetical protein ABT236_04590 [Streptomyces sp. NPDC001523]|uniref:hypothetical protein n=1 Tax=Streptomyces sp. NPDC001523 TaxID=3154383 RepID=UPI00331770BC